MKQRVSLRLPHCACFPMPGTCGAKDHRKRSPDCRVNRSTGAAEALAALSDIIGRAQRAGRIDAADGAAFGVYALAVLGTGWELRPGSDAV
jgi:hypothetical protein